MEFKVGQKVRVSENLYNAHNFLAYKNAGYEIGHVYEVTGIKDHGTMVAIQLKNNNPFQKSLWMNSSYLSVIKNDAKATLIQTSAILKERQNDIYDEIKRLQSESDLILDTLEYLEKLEKEIK